VLTTVLVAEHPVPNWSIVAGYAAGLYGMTRNLALDLKPIRVNLVSPGGLDTELWKDVEADERERCIKRGQRRILQGMLGRRRRLRRRICGC
jgi:NAD(P)-dependent dehydrogenase (short-subunit alcohol dehydrogenase family)